MRLKILLLTALMMTCVVTFSQEKIQKGKASYYASRFEGRLTANGEVFSNDSLTAAHPTLPFGTKVKITNIENGKEVVLRVNDRGPFVEGRIVDVTQKAAEKLGFYHQGICIVSLQILNEAK